MSKDITGIKKKVERARRESLQDKETFTEFTKRFASENLVDQFAATLVFHTTVLTLTMFLPFTDSGKKMVITWEVIAYVLTMVKSIIMMFAPAFTAGLLSVEVEKLLLTLRDKVILTKDDIQQRDIKRFIRYVEARPLKFTVYSIIPLNWKLPVIIINMSITYLIVMIQFTHKY